MAIGEFEAKMLCGCVKLDLDQYKSLLMRKISLVVLTPEDSLMTPSRVIAVALLIMFSVSSLSTTAQTKDEHAAHHPAAPAAKKPAALRCSP